MSIPQTKTELVRDIKTSFAKLQQKLDLVPPEKANELLLDGQIKGTKMSVNMLLAYLIGWGEEVVNWNKFWQKEKKPAQFPTSDYGKIAQDFYEKYNNEDFGKLREQLDAIYAEIVEFVESLDENELYGTVWYRTKSSGREYSFGRLIQINTSSPCRNAINRLRKIIKKEEK